GGELAGEVPRRVRAVLAPDARPVLRRAARQPELGRREAEVHRHGSGVARPRDVRYGREPDARRTERLAPRVVSGRRPGPGPSTRARGGRAGLGRGAVGRGDGPSRTAVRPRLQRTWT